MYIVVCHRKLPQPISHSYDPPPPRRYPLFLLPVFSIIPRGVCIKHTLLTSTPPPPLLSLQSSPAPPNKCLLPFVPQSIDNHHSDPNRRNFYGVWVAPPAVALLAYASLNSLDDIDDIQRVLFCECSNLVLRRAMYFTLSVICACILPRLIFYVFKCFSSFINEGAVVFSVSTDERANACVSFFV